ncbi:hypothetical protein NJ17_004364 [Salmonella enterica subsp. enterica]|nr:hypothetical protein [Salmonella enterica subsp. enterica]
MIVYTENVFFLSGIQNNKTFTSKDFKDINIYDLGTHVCFCFHNSDQADLYHTDDLSKFIDLIRDGIVLRKNSIYMTTSFLYELQLAIKIKNFTNRKSLNYKEVRFLKWLLLGKKTHEYAKVRNIDVKFLYNKKTLILDKININSLIRLYNIYLIWNKIRFNPHQI